MPQILLISSSESERLSIRQVLTTMPYSSEMRLWEAATGDQAVQQLQTLHPDLIILTTDLTDISGFHLSQNLKRETAFSLVPILLLSKPGEISKKMQAGLDCGADGYIDRPFDTYEFQAQVRVLLRLKANYDQLQQARTAQTALHEMLFHDMGNLITMITASLEFYPQVPTGSPEADQAVQDAQEASLMLAQMLNDLLDIGRLEARTLPLRRVPTDLVQFLQQLIRLFRSAALEKKINLELQFDNPPREAIKIDDSLLQRVIANLLMNALKYGPVSSRVQVMCGTAISSGAVRQFRISVSDEGPGIAPERQPYLFNKEFLAQYCADHHEQERIGHGLGLPFCKLAVEAHGGQLFVESEAGRGATFTLLIPYG